LTIDEKEKRRMEGKKLQKKERNILRREMKSMGPKEYSFFFFILKLIFILNIIDWLQQVIQGGLLVDLFWEVHIRGHLW